MTIQTPEKLEELRAKLDQIESAIADFQPEIDEGEFEEALDNMHGDVEVCGMTYPAGRALREIDPIAFKVGKSDYEASIDPEECDEYNDLIAERDELQDEIEELESELDEDE